MAQEASKAMLCCFPGRQKIGENSISKEGRCTAESKAALVSSVPNKEQSQVSYSCISVDSCGQTNLEGVSTGHMTAKKLKFPLSGQNMHSKYRPRRDSKECTQKGCLIKQPSSYFRSERY